MDLAQRAMDCGDAGHILLSKRVADDLAPYPRWHPHLHEIGAYEIKPFTRRQAAGGRDRRTEARDDVAHG
jgi:hypothetical protein